MNSYEWMAEGKLVDLTHTINSQTPTWDGSCGFHRTIKMNYEDFSGQTQFRIEEMTMRAGIGTHMDAPRHSFEKGISIAEISLNHLLAPLIVIDVSKEAHADYLVSARDVTDFEKIHGRIPKDALVLFFTGWSSYWKDAVRYRNVDNQGNVHFPSIAEEAGKLLMDRGVLGLAVDTLSPDLGWDGYFPIHEIFLGAGKYLVENVANARHLPPTGALGIILPIKVEDGVEAPVRFIACQPKH